MIDFDHENNIISLKLNKGFQSRPDKREIWDGTIHNMIKLSYNKLVIDATYSDISDLNGFFFVFEGLIQIMVRQIRSSRLNVAVIFGNKNLFDESQNWNFNPWHNQHKEIEIRFFTDNDKAIAFLNSISSDSLWSKVTSKFIKPRKTTIEEEFEVLAKEQKIDTSSPVYKIWKKEQIENYKRMNA